MVFVQYHTYLEIYKGMGVNLNLMIKKIKSWFGQHTNSVWNNVINENTQYINIYIELIGKEGNAPSLTGYILTLDQCNRALEAVNGRSDKKFIRQNHIVEDIKMRCPNYPKSIIEYKKDDSLTPIRASSVEDAVNQFRERLLKKEALIPEGTPHTIWVFGIQIQWDYYN